MKKTERLFAAAVFAVAALCLLPGCKAERKEPKKDRVVIGFSIATDTFIIERWNKDLKIFTGAVRDRGADVIVQLSAGGTKEQIAQINFLLTQNIDALVVIPHDSEMLSGVVKKARDAKIPVIAYDRPIMGVPIDAFVSFNNREVGRLFGKALTQNVPKGKYLIVNGSIKDNNSYEVNAGFHEIIDPFVKQGSISIVDEIWLNDWSSDEALEKIGTVLERTTDIDAISCAKRPDRERGDSASFRIPPGRQGRRRRAGRRDQRLPEDCRGYPTDDRIQADRPSRRARRGRCRFDSQR